MHPTVGNFILLISLFFIIILVLFVFNLLVIYAINTERVRVRIYSHDSDFSSVQDNTLRELEAQEETPRIF